MPERALEPYPSPTWPQLVTGSTGVVLWLMTVMFVIVGCLGFILAR